jgi:hypothetical protein
VLTDVNRSGVGAFFDATWPGNTILAHSPIDLAHPGERIMTVTLSNARDIAVYSVLTSQYSQSKAEQWLLAWQEMSAKRSSVYDAIVSFVDLIESSESSLPTAWLRVMLIDAVTRTERQRLLAA